MSDRSLLLGFGFSEAKVAKALKVTKNAGLQPALDWLADHGEDNDDDDGEGGMDVDQEEEDKVSTIEITKKAAESSSSGVVGGEDGEITAGESTAQSLKCDDCGKLFKDCRVFLPSLPLPLSYPYIIYSYLC
jgi:UBX domain-containing protein 1/4